LTHTRPTQKIGRRSQSFHKDPLFLARAHCALLAPTPRAQCPTRHCCVVVVVVVVRKRKCGAAWELNTTLLGDSVSVCASDPNFCAPLPRATVKSGIQQTSFSSLAPISPLSSDLNKGNSKGPVLLLQKKKQQSVALTQALQEFRGSHLWVAVDCALE
jgi:hypothetical protein